MNLWHIYISLLGYSSNGELGDGAVSRKNNIPVPESALDGLDFACPGVITTHQQKALTAGPMIGLILLTLRRKYRMKVNQMVDVA